MCDVQSMMSVRKPYASGCVECHGVDEAVEEGRAVDDAGGQDQEPGWAFGEFEVEKAVVTSEDILHNLSAAKGLVHVQL